MLTKKQLKVIDAFRNHIGTKLTAEQIKQIANINLNKFLYKALSNCMYEGIMRNEQVGRSFLYHLEINNKSALYLGLLATEFHNLPNDILSYIEMELYKKIPTFIGLVFGSYARKDYNKDSGKYAEYSLVATLVNLSIKYFECSMLTL